MLPVLGALDAAGLPLGHRHQQGARASPRPVVRGAGLHRARRRWSAATRTPHAKPHPAPLLEAARRLERGRRPTASTSVTTCATSQAGRAAGMPTLAAAWGYLGAGDDDRRPGAADAVLAEPAALLNWLELA